ncbi:uncharacterized protein HMPREF1541_04438 [Cyphellophora europaea CBS 101466]|uniref:Uncharacterized protein n=1 Tax=Cyphellophora europaea (strain CBS 101466) TaxID=1220924 RepID=W2RUN4_CYPE1|nr:uncharacterized protein HMPREF1541_04438 [Cyphellophora europaea CBS 101466]ETN40162.1 hypothetical protein HMPREF1541_04438 [Cyphellophora europaea CBS 101466]
MPGVIQTNGEASGSHQKSKSITLSQIQVSRYDNLAEAFANTVKITSDLKRKVNNVKNLDKELDEKESVLDKNLRVSSTMPVALALEDASRALADFETTDMLGETLKHGLPKEIAGITAFDIAQIQKKLAEKRNLQLNSLYAQFLRCPADKYLEQYVPRTTQCPKPTRVKTELREAIAQKTAIAVKEAQREVLSKYSGKDELQHVMDRYEQICAEAVADDRIIAKQLGNTYEVLQARTDGEPMAKLSGKPSLADVKALVSKIKIARTEAIKTEKQTQEALKKTHQNEMAAKYQTALSHRKARDA